MKKLQDKLASIDKSYYNEIRWWLAEGLHTDETLKNEVKLLDEAGFGAAEFLAMGDYGVDVTRYGWGSEEFVHDTHLILDEVTRRGMGASMTSGTNWSNANLNNIVPDDRAAAKELAYVAENVKAGETYAKKIPHAIIKQKAVFAQTLITVVAMKDLGISEDGRRTRLGKTGIVLTDKVVDEYLEWTAPEDGDYILFTVWMQGTGQTASPSCSINYTINYIDKYGTEALIDYWNKEVLSDSMRKTLSENKRVQLFMDSLELTTFANAGQFWGYHFMDEFKSRRGYDLAPYLPHIFKYTTMMMLASTPYRYVCEDELFFRKLKNDFYQTMTDMYMENVLKPIQEWLHGVDMTLRAQISYGLPFEISQPGKYVDGIETESLAYYSQVDSYRGMAGAAHIYDRVYSSETGATRMNYKMGLDFTTQIIYAQFAAGITRTVLHGYASIVGSEGITQWPGHEGMLPVFSDRFGPRQPSYLFYNDWNNMIARYQYFLRQGKPRMDLGMLRLDYAYNNQVLQGTDEIDSYENKLIRGNEGLYWKSCELQNAGYTYDYFAPQLLKDAGCGDGTVGPDGPGYQAIIIYQDMLDVESAEVLLDYAKQGVKVLFVNGVTETLAMGCDATYEKAAAMTPFNDGRDAELAGIVAAIKAEPTVKEITGTGNALAALREMGVEPRVRFEKANRNVLPVLREDGEMRYVYMYNCMYTEKKPVTYKVEILGEGVPYAVNCWTGKVARAASYEIKNGRTVVEITLQPGEACLYAVDTSEIAAADATEPMTAAVTELPRWNLKVESWDAGERREITEDRGLGYVTKEIYYETAKTVIDAGEVELISWKDIPAIGAEVSGVGYYTTEIELAASFKKVEFATDTVVGATQSVYVNGQKADAVDFNNPVVDITELVRPGKNTIEVRVSSTLVNRLLARGYFRDIPKMMGMIMSDPTIFGEMHRPDPENRPPRPEGAPERKPFSGRSFECEPQDYGMIGSAKIVTYA